MTENHIRWRVDSKWASNFHAIADKPTENGSLTLCGAEATDDDEVWRMCGPSYPENAATITCGECKRLRQIGYSPNPIEGVTLVPNLARRILDAIETTPDAFTPGLTGFSSLASHAIWPEDDTTYDIAMGVAGWACHLSGWRLSADDMGAAWAFEEDWEQRRDPVELAVEFLGLDSSDLLEDPDRDAVIAGLQELAERDDH